MKNKKNLDLNKEMNFLFVKGGNKVSKKMNEINYQKKFKNQEFFDQKAKKFENREKLIKLLKLNESLTLSNKNYVYENLLFYEKIIKSLNILIENEKNINVKKQLQNEKKLIAENLNALEEGIITNAIKALGKGAWNAVKGVPGKLKTLIKPKTAAQAVAKAAVKEQLVANKSMWTGVLIKFVTRDVAFSMLIDFILFNMDNFKNLMPDWSILSGISDFPTNVKILASKNENWSGFLTHIFAVGETADYKELFDYNMNIDDQKSKEEEIVRNAGGFGVGPKFIFNFGIYCEKLLVDGYSRMLALMGTGILFLQDFSKFMKNFFTDEGQYIWENIKKIQSAKSVRTDSTTGKSVPKTAAKDIEGFWKRTGYYIGKTFEWSYSALEGFGGYIKFLFRVFKLMFQIEGSSSIPLVGTFWNKFWGWIGDTSKNPSPNLRTDFYQSNILSTTFKNTGGGSAMADDLAKNINAEKVNPYINQSFLDDFQNIPSDGVTFNKVWQNDGRLSDEYSKLLSNDCLKVLEKVGQGESTAEKIAIFQGLNSNEQLYLSAPTGKANIADILLTDTGAARSVGKELVDEPMIKELIIDNISKETILELAKTDSQTAVAVTDDLAKNIETPASSTLITAVDGSNKSVNSIVADAKHSDLLGLNNHNYLDIERTNGVITKMETTSEIILYEKVTGEVIIIKKGTDLLPLTVTDNLLNNKLILDVTEDKKNTIMMMKKPPSKKPIKPSPPPTPKEIFDSIKKTMVAANAKTTIFSPQGGGKVIRFNLNPNAVPSYIPTTKKYLLLEKIFEILNKFKTQFVKFTTIAAFNSSSSATKIGMLEKKMASLSGLPWPKIKIAIFFGVILTSLLGGFEPYLRQGLGNFWETYHNVKNPGSVKQEEEETDNTQTQEKIDASNNTPEEPQLSKPTEEPKKQNNIAPPRKRSK